jgi:trimethylamine--corrinoid protein Co-methyltransferase
MTMLPAVYGRVNFVLHAAGWLENGMTAGYEKFVLDCEILGMLHTMLKGVDLSEEAQAMDSLRSVEPGGHHLGTEHTMRHFRDAFYRPELFDYQDVDMWEAQGSPSSVERAAAKVERMLAAYTAPEIDPALVKALDEFIAARSAELL